MGSVKLSGLNDYLNPSPECILPLTKPNRSFQVTLRNEKKNNDNEIIKVSLSDCLSCSGCLTSSVPMLENNFYLEVYNNFIKSKCPVLSISTQSLLSFCSLYKLKLTEAFIKIKKFFIGKGVKFVFNQSISEAIQIEESKKEFDRSYKPNSTLICSNCPGWVIYAEKSLENEFLGNMSRLMPLQGIQGLLVKLIVTIRCKIESSRIKYRKIFNPLLNVIGNVDDIRPEDIYHLCITPCHDKKLELLRPDMVANYSSLCKLLQIDSSCIKTPLIDGVITTNELLELIKDDFSNSLDKCELDDFSDLLTFEDLQSIRALLGLGKLNSSLNIGFSPFDITEFAHSGGYAEELLKYVSQKYSQKFSQKNIPQFRNKSNKDYKQAHLIRDGMEHSDQIRIEVATGFRNIANIVSGISSFSGFNYIELMACPGGCINGGGQIKNISIDISNDDRSYISSDRIPIIIELEDWLWDVIGNLVTRDDGLLSMELKSIKDNRLDW